MIHSLIRLILIIICVLITANSCKQKNKPLVTSKNELIVFLDSLEQRYESACTQMGLATWNSYTKDGPYDLGAAKTNFVKIFLDTSARRTIEEWRKKSGSLADILLTRRLELWYRCFVGGVIYSDSEITAMENSLQQKITNFKFNFKGNRFTQTQINTLLSNEKKQSQRHKLWVVTSQLTSEIMNDLLRLVKLRNERAKTYGFPNFYSLMLYLQATDENWLLKTMSKLEEHTRLKFEASHISIKKKLRVEKLGPWDFDFSLSNTISLPDKYFSSTSVLDVVYEFHRGIGFSVDSLPIKMIMKNIPINGLSLSIKIPTDSRIIINPKNGKKLYSILSYEYGCALKAVNTTIEYPILKGYEWIPGAHCTAYREGIANMHAEFTDDSLWLSKFTDSKPKEIERYIRGRGLLSLYLMRNALKDFFLEYEMYKNPNQDMTIVGKEIVRQYLLVDLSVKEPIQFPSLEMYSLHPCSSYTYIISEMIATQLQEALNNKFGDERINNLKTANWMIKYLYASGETEEWYARIRNATGKSLETGAYLRKLGIEQSDLITKENNQ